MGQTTEILPRARRVYKKIFRSPKIGRMARGLLDWGVERWARLRGFAFPEKFNWDWKWEMLAGKYEESTTKFFQGLMKPGMTAVDIGAHVGYFTRQFAQNVGSRGKVFGFEPDPDNFRLLRENVKKYPQAEIFNAAVSDREGMLDFYQTVEKTGSHSLVPSDFRPKKISVPARTLDGFWISRGKPRFDVIKMDIEGAEPLALEGMKEVIKALPELKLVVEFSPENLQLGGCEPARFLSRLEKLGLSIQAIYPEGPRPFGSGDLPALAAEKNGYVNLFMQRGIYK